MKYKYPQDGDKKVCKVFALLPERIDGGVGVWLEWFFEELTYRGYRQNGYWLPTRRWQEKSLSKAGKKLAI